MAISKPRFFAAFLGCLYLSAFLCQAAGAYNYSARTRFLNKKRHQLFSSYASVMGDEIEPVLGHSEAGRFERNMRLYEKRFALIPHPLFKPDPKNLAHALDIFEPTQASMEQIRSFLIANVTDTRMPLSFFAPKEYWRDLNEDLDLVEAVLERTLIANSLNIYDGAVWQIALSALPSREGRALADLETERLSRGEAGEIRDLKAYGPMFRYGDEEVMMDRDGGYFFRMISDRYIQDDPLGQNEVPGYPNSSRVHHEDWKPITGEQAWAAIIGPLQSAYLKYGADIPVDSAEMKLALAILPAFQAMQSPIGALYHAPKGTYGIHSKLISTENNISVYAALKMLEPYLKKQARPEAEPVRVMLEKLEDFFVRYAYDKKSHYFLAAGFYVEGKWVPSRLFASDCQTWAIGALGPEWIDAHFGEGESYQIWKTMLYKSGRRKNTGEWEGISFSSDRAVTTVEWTCGAILAARLMADFYAKSHPDWTALLREEISEMRTGIEKYRASLSGNRSAYLYSSERYFIPFGWWANPVPSLSASAWVLLTDLNFDPFKLGGGPEFHA